MKKATPCSILLQAPKLFLGGGRGAPQQPVGRGGWQHPASPPSPLGAPRQAQPPCGPPPHHILPTVAVPQLALAGLGCWLGIPLVARGGTRSPSPGRMDSFSPKQWHQNKRLLLGSQALQCLHSALTKSSTSKYTLESYFLAPIFICLWIS